MRLLVQRVKKASVSVDGKTVGAIEQGLLIFFGCHKDDVIAQVSYLAQKVANLRIFSDSNDKMNLSLKDIQKSALVISQFTLYADSIEGRRPSFSDAAPPHIAEGFYHQFIIALKKEISQVESGVFQAKMEVELINDGPATFLIDAKKF